MADISVKLITVAGSASVPAESSGADWNKDAVILANEYDQNNINLRAAIQRLGSSVGMGTFFAGLSNKATPIAADKLALVDTESSNALKYVTLTNLLNVFSAKAGPGSGQAFATGALTVTGDVTVNGTSSNIATSGSSSYVQTPTVVTDKLQCRTGSADITVKNYSGTLLATFANSGAVAIPGNLLVGVGSGSNHQILKVVTADAGNIVFNSGTVAMSSSLITYGVSAFGANAANSAVKVGKDGITLRSISTGGTINASGADYAEYEQKSDTCGNVSKGQIIGFDANGQVTDKWAKAISFGVKSTNPNLVGGDTWGNEDAVGKRPEQPIRVAGDTYAEWSTKESQYASDLADFEARLEAERQKVDRVAYAGKVPCNVLGASVGDYIVAVQEGANIRGEVVTTPTFDQYRLAVGRVRRILEDGRAEIAMMVH